MLMQKFLLVLHSVAITVMFARGEGGQIKRLLWSDGNFTTRDAETKLDSLSMRPFEKIRRR